LHGAFNEPFGMAPLEAIASGTPVVAHKSGGLQEFISERSGKMVDSDDPKIWGKVCADYLELILAQPDFHNEVRASARQFDWNITLKPALEIIAKVAASGVTVVLVEHDMKLVMNLSTRITVLDYGKKLAEGTPSEVRANPDVIAAYLGHPA
jgi:hypothetical protein